MGDSVEVVGNRYCDFCAQEGMQVLAIYDGATQLGPWANMCESHFRIIGVGLGTGKGQKLIYVQTEGDGKKAGEGETAGP